MDYLFDLIEQKRFDNPINIAKLFTQAKYVVDQSVKDNEPWDIYKAYLFENKNVFHSYMSGLDKADAYTVTGRHFPRLKTFLIEQAITRNLPILFEENGFIRSITSFTQFQYSTDDPKYSAAISYCYDDLSYHFDGTRPTRIECLLNSNLQLTEEQLEYSRKMIKKILIIIFQNIIINP